MFGFLGGGGGAGAGGGGGRGNRKRWWSLGGGGGVGGLLDEEAEDAAVVVAAAAPRGQQQEQREESVSSSGRRRRGGKEKELTDIERLRQENLKQNQAFLQSLGIGQAKAALAQEAAGAGPSGGGGVGGQQQGRKRKRGRSLASGGGSSVPTLEQVSGKWVGREEQVRALARLLPVSPAAAAASDGALHVEEGAGSSVLLVHGPSGAGKTGVLRDLLPALRLPHAYVRGPEHPTARSFYGAVAAAWMRFIEAQAKALGMEGLGYVAGTDDVDMDYAEEEARALKEARREERRRRRQEERRQRRLAAREGEGSGTEDEGTGDEESSEGGGGESEEEDSDDEEDDEQDGYWNQTAPLAGGGGAGGGGGASLVPLNRVATASGLLHLLRSWRGFQQQPSSSSSTQPQHMTPFVIVLDGADRLPRGAAQVRHEIVELPSMLAGARGRGGGFTMGHGAGAGGGNGTSPLVALTVVLISETPQAAPAALAAGYGLPVPFPAYSKAEATAILLRSLRVAAGLSSSSSSTSTSGSGSAFGTLASSFAALLVGSLYSSTRDVREMRRMAALLSQAYLGPLLQPQPQPQDKEKENDSNDQQQQQLLASPTALLERIRPLLARATQHCLHMPAEPLEQPHAQPPKGVKKEGATGAASMAQALTVTRFEALLRYELPALARFLVVAAYLASHVAPDTDLFLFAAGSAKSGAGKKRSAKQAVRQERQAEEREAEAEKLGARSFSLERLLSIFTCLLASSRSQGAAYANSTGTTELFAQVNALVHHRLLTRVHSRGGGGGGSKGAGPPPELTAAKFKCNVGYELVLETARELEVKLDMYLSAGRTKAGTSGGGK